jgi:hypothetical protein
MSTPIENLHQLDVDGITVYYIRCYGSRELVNIEWTEFWMTKPKSILIKPFWFFKPNEYAITEDCDFKINFDIHNPKYTKIDIRNEILRGIKSVRRRGEII